MPCAENAASLQKTGTQPIAQRVTVIISPMAVCLAQTHAPCASIHFGGVEGFVWELAQLSQELLLSANMLSAVEGLYIRDCLLLP